METVAKFPICWVIVTYFAKCGKRKITHCIVTNSHREKFCSKQFQKRSHDKKYLKIGRKEENILTTQTSYLSFKYILSLSTSYSTRYSLIRGCAEKLLPLNKLIYIYIYIYIYFFIQHIPILNLHTY